MPEIEKCFKDVSSKLHKILDALVCQEYDVQRINGALVKLQAELKERVEEIVLAVNEMRADAVICIESNDELESQAKALKNVIDCFKERAEKLKKSREAVMACSESCITDLHSVKITLKKVFDETIECLKCNATSSRDVNVFLAYKSRIITLQNMFVDDVKLTKSVENKLRPYLEQLKACGITVVCKDDPFEIYLWLPPAPDMDWLKNLTEDMKKKMGKIMIGAFAQMHLLRPTDKMKFLALYFWNEQNKKIEDEEIPNCQDP